MPLQMEPPKQWFSAQLHTWVKPMSLKNGLGQTPPQTSWFSQFREAQACFPGLLSAAVDGIHGFRGVSENSLWLVWGERGVLRGAGHHSWPSGPSRVSRNDPKPCDWPGPPGRATSHSSPLPSKPLWAHGVGRAYITARASQPLQGRKAHVVNEPKRSAHTFIYFDISA